MKNILLNFNIVIIIIILIKKRRKSGNSKIIKVEFYMLLFNC